MYLRVPYPCADCVRAEVQHDGCLMNVVEHWLVSAHAAPPFPTQHLPYFVTGISRSPNSNPSLYDWRALRIFSFAIPSRAERARPERARAAVASSPIL